MRSRRSTPMMVGAATVAAGFVGSLWVDTPRPAASIATLHRESVALVAPPASHAAPLARDEIRTLRGRSAAAPAAPAHAAEPSRSERALALRFVDAFDGRPVPDVEAWAWSECGCDSEPHDVVVTRDADILRVAPYDDGARIEAKAPRGYVDWDLGSIRFVKRARHATSFESVWPLHREISLTVHLTGPDGATAHDAVFGQFRIDGRSGAAGGRAQKGGLAVVGVPFLPGETLELDAGWERGRADATLRVELPEVPPHLYAGLALPPPGAPAVDVPTPSGRGATHGGRSVCGCGCGGARAYGDVSVRVLRRDGRPAAGASIRLDRAVRRTDPEGRLVFERVREGRRTVALSEPGLVPTSETVGVVEGETTEVTLREPEGARLDVVVVDEAGRRARFAHVSPRQPSAVEWLDVRDDGLQRLDPFVDERGERTLSHVEPGEVEVRATFGRRTGVAKVQALEGRTTRVVVVVSPPTGTPIDAR